MAENLFFIKIQKVHPAAKKPQDVLDGRQAVIEQVLAADPGFPEFREALALLKRARGQKFVLEVRRRMRHNMRKPFRCPLPYQPGRPDSERVFSRGWGKAPWIDAERQFIVPGRTAFIAVSALAPGESRIGGREMLQCAREAGVFAGQRSIEALCAAQRKLPDTHKDVIRYVGIGTVWRRGGETAIPCLAAYRGGPWFVRWVSLDDTFGDETRLLKPIGSSRPALVR